MSKRFYFIYLLSFTQHFEFSAKFNARCQPTKKYEGKSSSVKRFNFATNEFKFKYSRQ